MNDIYIYIYIATFIFHSKKAAKLLKLITKQDNNKAGA